MRHSSSPPATLSLALDETMTIEHKRHCSSTSSVMGDSIVLDSNSNHSAGNNSGLSLLTNSSVTVVTQPQISDYSPEWSYSEGGMKILVAGPWYSSSLNYSILFDGISVPTSLVQDGVLRCYSPAHEPGFVALQVSIGGNNIVSNSVIFEYRDHPSTPSQCSEDYFSVDGEFFLYSHA